MPVGFLGEPADVVGYALIVLLTCLTTSLTALFCSALSDRTSVSLVWTYLVLVTLFTAPLAARFFAMTFFPDAAERRGGSRRPRSPARLPPR